MDEQLKLEKEISIPFHWKTNTILIRDGKGNLIELDVPNDEED